jgi:hypothetical protein
MSSLKVDILEDVETGTGSDLVDTLSAWFYLAVVVGLVGLLVAEIVAVIG